MIERCIRKGAGTACFWCLQRTDGKCYDASPVFVAYWAAQLHSTMRGITDLALMTMPSALVIVPFPLTVALDRL